MKPQLWVVIPFIEQGLKGGNAAFGYNSIKLQPYLQDQLEMFGDPNTAHAYANAMSTLNGGKSYIVCDPTSVYYAAPSKTTRKTWKNGELVPE